MPFFDNNNNYLGSNNLNQQQNIPQTSLGGTQVPSFEQGLQNVSLPGAGSAGTQVMPPQVGQTGGGFFGNVTAQGIGQGLQGLAGIGQAGLGVANYFQNKRNFKDMMNLQLADRKTQLGLANQSIASERARLKRGGVSDENLKDVPTSVS